MKVVKAFQDVDGVVLPVPKELNIGDNEEFQAIVGADGSITYTPVNKNSNDVENA